MRLGCWKCKNLHEICMKCTYIYIKSAYQCITWNVAKKTALKTVYNLYKTASSASALHNKSALSNIHFPYFLHVSCVNLKPNSMQNYELFMQVLCKFYACFVHFMEFFHEMHKKITMPQYAEAWRRFVFPFCLWPDSACNCICTQSPHLPPVAGQHLEVKWQRRANLKHWRCHLPLWVARYCCG